MKEEIITLICDTKYVIFRNGVVEEEAWSKIHDIHTKPLLAVRTCGAMRKLVVVVCIVCVAVHL